MIRRLYWAGLAMLMVVPAVAQAQPPTVGAPPPSAALVAETPYVTAEAWVLYDATYDAVIDSKNQDEQRAMASTTKIMSALVALEVGNLSDRVEISETAAEIGEAEADLVAGEVWRLEDLIRVMLVQSANDAAIAVAEHVGGSVDGFVDLMNTKTEQLGLQNTHFTNPHGLDDDAHYTSAADLLSLARVAMENEVFAEMARTRTAKLPPHPGGQDRVAHATNQLLGTFPGAIGIKTGYTARAGLVFVAAAEREGRRLYAVVMGSDDHFTDAATLLEFGFSRFGVVKLLTAGDPYVQRRLPGSSEGLTAATDFEIFMAIPEAEDITLVPKASGAEINVQVLVDDVPIGSAVLEGGSLRPLPGLKGALGWASRYWDWMWGNG